jgi:EAL domain-containing protein (putative c-di-GMP-specific phosphodiesterase class I)
MWRSAGLELDLAINVSGRDLADARFPEEVAQALAEHGVDPSWLELEITESVLLSDRVRASRMLERLVDEGVRIAIDDFGVGYSSLGQLKNLPAHVLKIDRSFVSSMESDRSDEAIVAYQRSLAYGISAVPMAIVFGWLASLAFRQRT